MNRKRAVKLMVSWLILLPICLRQDLAMVFGQSVLQEVKVDAQTLKREPVVLFVEQERLNPFLSREEEYDLFGPKKPPAPVVLDYFNLSAIFCSQVRTENKAIINGMIYRTGDEIDARNSKKIVEIQPRTVVLKDSNGLEYLLMLNKGSEK